jgi:hypothetical protein
LKKPPWITAKKIFLSVSIEKNVVRIIARKDFKQIVASIALLKFKLNLSVLFQTEPDVFKVSEGKVRQDQSLNRIISGFDTET